MAEGVIQDEIFDGGTRHSSFEIKHEAACLIIPNWFSIRVDIHTVSVDLVVEKLVESRLFAIDFRSL